MAKKQESQPILYALVLAAGSSQRLGRPKQLLQLDDETLLRRCCRVAGELCDDHVYVVLGADFERMQKEIADQSLEIVHNPDWESGIGSSLAAGISALPKQASAVLILLCDQPLVGTQLLAPLVRLWQRRPDSIIAGAYVGTLGVPAIFPRAWFKELQAQNGDRGARELLRSNAADVVSVVLPEAGWDLDTPADVSAIETWLGRTLKPAANGHS